MAGRPELAHHDGVEGEAELLCHSGGDHDTAAGDAEHDGIRSPPAA
jgi:hypothetical protein